MVLPSYVRGLEGFPSREMKVDRFGWRCPDPRVTSGGPQLRADRSLVDASVRGVDTSWNTSSRQIFWTQVCSLGPCADDDVARVQGKSHRRALSSGRGVAVQWCVHGLAVRRQVVDVSHLPRLVGQARAHRNHIEPGGQRRGNGGSTRFGAGTRRAGPGFGLLDGGEMTITLNVEQPDLVAPVGEPPRRRRKVLRRVLIVTGSVLVALIVLAGSWIGVSLYRIDHAVHHVGIPAWLLARGKNDLLAIVKGPDHSEQIFVFHDTGGHTNVLKIPNKLGLPLATGGRTVPIDTLSLHTPITLIAGLDKLGIPVSHYVGVDLHMVSPTSSLGELARQAVGHRPLPRTRPGPPRCSSRWPRTSISDPGPRSRPSSP